MILDLLILDEIQNFVKYSTQIESNINKNIKQIWTSATPEQYLIFEENYYYVNCFKEIYHKKVLNLIISYDHKQDLIDLIDINRKQLIFLNNKQLSKNWAENIPSINFTYLNTNEKMNEDCVEIIKNEEITSGITHLFCTSFISDVLILKI